MLAELDLSQHYALAAEVKRLMTALNDSAADRCLQPIPLSFLGLLGYLHRPRTAFIRQCSAEPRFRQSPSSRFQIASKL
jgi:hypothetical protein